MESLRSNKSGHQPSKRVSSYGIAVSGLVFYFAHVLQQAHARDTALMNDPLSSEATLTHDLTDSQAPIAVASVDQLEPVMIESNTSQAVTTTLVSDDEEDDQAIEASGKDAIDVPSQSVSPLLLLGGAALIGGGIAVLANDNDDDSSSTHDLEEPGLISRPDYSPEFTLSGALKPDGAINVDTTSSDDTVMRFYRGDHQSTISTVEELVEISSDPQDGNRLPFSEDFIGYDIYAEISNGDETTMVGVVNGYDTLYMDHLGKHLTTSWEEVAQGVYQAAAPAVLNNAGELGVGALANTTLTMTTAFAIADDATEPLFVFRAEHSLNEGDVLQAIVSIDSGATWLSVGDPLTGHNDGNEYTQISLGDYSGEDNVLLGMRFTSDAYHDDDGLTIAPTIRAMKITDEFTAIPIHDELIFSDTSGDSDSDGVDDWLNVTHSMDGALLETAYWSLGAHTENGNYSNYMTSTLTLIDPITIPDSAILATYDIAPMFSFDGDIHTENGFDSLQLQGSTNSGATWGAIASNQYTNGHSSHDATGGGLANNIEGSFEFDLTGYMGETLLLRFEFKSDGSVYNPGIQLRNFETNFAEIVIDNLITEDLSMEVEFESPVYDGTVWEGAQLQSYHIEGLEAAQITNNPYVTQYSEALADSATENFIYEAGFKLIDRFNEGSEADGLLSIPLVQSSRDKASTYTITAEPITANHNDYALTTDGIIFTPGLVASSISVNLVNDDLMEGDETFSVTMTDRLGFSSTGEFTIISDLNDTVIPYRIEGMATEGHVISLMPNEVGHILQEVVWLRGDNLLTEDVEQDTIIGNALTYALTEDDFACEIVAEVTYEDSLGNIYTAFTGSVHPEPGMFLKALSDGNPDLIPNHLAWYAMQSHDGDGPLGYHANSMDYAFMTLNSRVFEAEDGMTLSFMSDIDTPDGNSDNGVGQDVFAVMYREEGDTSFTLLETNTVAFDFTSVDTDHLSEYGVTQGYGGNDLGSRELSYDLSSLEGKNIQLQFVCGSDATTSNWWDLSENTAGLYEGVMLEDIKITKTNGEVVLQSDLTYHPETDSYIDSFMAQSLATGLDADSGNQAAARFDFGSQLWSEDGQLDLLQISHSNLSSFPSDEVDHLAGIHHLDASNNQLENSTLGVSMLDLLGPLEYVSFENTGILWDPEVQNLYQADIDEGLLTGTL
ncbi:MAG TPA: hypothetical protein DCL40_02335 [Coxiellaceae bacterium]|nr:hypothetical protein [Coxiellaceae bacterium]